MHQHQVMIEYAAMISERDARMWELSGVSNIQVPHSSCLAVMRSTFKPVVSGSNIMCTRIPIYIRDDVKLAQLVRARDCQSRGRRFDAGKNSKTENSNLHGIEVHRPSSKGTKLMFQVIKAIINQCF